MSRKVAKVWKAAAFFDFNFKRFLLVIPILSTVSFLQIVELKYLVASSQNPAKILKAHIFCIPV